MKANLKLIKIFIAFSIALVWSNESSAGTWIQKASMPSVGRHRCEAFSVGNRGYMGLGHVNSQVHIIYRDMWEYNPASNSWTQIADFGGSYRYHTTSFTIDSVAYVGLGMNNNDEYENDWWMYNPATNSWSQVGDFPGIERRGATSFMVNDTAYVGLGQTDLGYASDFYKYDPLADSWSPIAVFPGAARTGGVGFGHDGKGYCGTGHTWSAALKDFWEYDPQVDMWTQKADVGDTLRQDACGFYVMGRAFLGTGNDVLGDVNYGDMWEYDFTLDTWTQIEDFGGQKRRFMASFVINDVAYCGSGTNGVNFNDLWAFYPVLSMDEYFENLNVVLYPNPVENILNVSSKSSLVNVEIDILTISGHQVRSIEFNNEINVSGLATGNYICVFRQNGNVLGIKKFIKR